jgi:hypothetical protein
VAVVVNMIGDERLDLNSVIGLARGDDTLWYFFATGSPCCAKQTNVHETGFRIVGLVRFWA